MMRGLNLGEENGGGRAIIFDIDDFNNILTALEYATGGA
jgi:hypothetical protein